MESNIFRSRVFNWRKLAVENARFAAAIRFPLLLKRQVFISESSGDPARKTYLVTFFALVLGRPVAGKEVYAASG